MVDPVYQFCLNHGLLDKQAVEYLSTIQERPPLDSLTAVLAHGVDEAVLFRLAAAENGLELLDAADWVFDESADLSPEHQKYFNTLALRRRKQSAAEASTRAYATTDFTRLERLRGALTNLLGREPDIVLVSLSQFEKLRTQCQ